MSDLFTTAEAAQFLRRTPGCLRKWRWQSVGPTYVRLSKSLRGPVLYRRSDLEAFVQAGTVTNVGNVGTEQSIGDDAAKKNHR